MLAALVWPLTVLVSVLIPGVSPRTAHVSPLMAPTPLHGPHTTPVAPKIWTRLVDVHALPAPVLPYVPHLRLPVDIHRCRPRMLRPGLNVVPSP